MRQLGRNAHFKHLIEIAVVESSGPIYTYKSATHQAINRAREMEMRAVSAEVRANNLPGNELLLKCGFDLAGIDTRRHSNHDVVKESATFIWYVALN